MTTEPHGTTLNQGIYHPCFSVPVCAFQWFNIFRVSVFICARQWLVICPTENHFSAVMYLTTEPHGTTLNQGLCTEFPCFSVLIRG